MKNYEGYVRPHNQQCREFADLVETLALPELKQSFAKLKANTPNEIQWLNYFSGLIKIKEDQDVNALVELQKVYESIKHRFVDMDRDHYRLAGLALKKIGWIYRKNKDFEKAYFYHNARYHYMSQYGSSLEIHDAAVSMDIDSYYLKDLKLSEFWLLISREAALNVQNPIDRARSLGITDNNLAGTYSSQKRFKEATDYIFKSLDSWIDYESLTGPHENKVVWGYYSVGDIFESWALHRKEINQSFSDEKSESEKAFKKSLEIALQRKILDTDIISIQDRLNKVLDLE